MDEDEDENKEYETGNILAAIRHREPFRHSKDWYVADVSVDNCADEHACSPRDIEWIAMEPSKNRHLVSAIGHKLKHYGEQSVPMKLRSRYKCAWSVSIPKGTTTFTTQSVSSGTEKVEKWKWTESETTTKWNAGSHQQTMNKRKT